MGPTGQMFNYPSIHKGFEGKEMEKLVDDWAWLEPLALDPTFALPRFGVPCYEA